MSGAPELSELESVIGYTFVDRKWLERALTHRSFANESGSLDNERLEFLGDAVVGLVVATGLMDRFPDAPEGQLSALRASIVSATGLAAAARRIDLGQWLRLGKGEAAHGGNEKSSLLANGFEAILGAVYRDGGFEPASRVAGELLAKEVSEARLGQVADHKTAYQEWCQANLQLTPHYEVVGESGPAHDKRFTVRVIVNGKEQARGEGPSKKAAEQVAAGRALEDTPR